MALITYGIILVVTGWMIKNAIRHMAVLNKPSQSDSVEAQSTNEKIALAEKQLVEAKLSVLMVEQKIAMAQVMNTFRIAIESKDNTIALLEQVAQDAVAREERAIEGFTKYLKAADIEESEINEILALIESKQPGDL